MIGINVQGFVGWVSSLGVTGLLILMLVALQQGWVVFARERDELKDRLQAMTAERDQWKTLALASLRQTERYTEVPVP